MKTQKSVSRKKYLAAGLAAQLALLIAGSALAQPSQSESAQFGPSSSIIRLSRAFFERSLAGSVSINEAGRTESNVSWVELPPTAPAPTGPVIADFRDHLGCATYDSAGGAQLCFRIQPDVSSVGVNARELSVRGLCGGHFENAKFVTGSYADGTLTALFIGTCNGQTQTAEFSLRQI